MCVSRLNFLTFVFLSCAFTPLGWCGKWGESDATLPNNNAIQRGLSKPLSNQERFHNELSSSISAPGQRNESDNYSHSLDDMDIPFFLFKRDTAGCAKRYLEYNLFSNNLGRVVKLCNAAMNDDSEKSFDFFSLAAATYYRCEDFNRAAELYGKLFEMDPDQCAFTYLKAAYSYYTLSNYKRAAELYDKCLELEPNPRPYWFIYAASSQFLNKSYTHAANLYDNLLEVDPDQSASTYDSAAYSHYQSGRHARAAELYDRLLKLDPNQDASTYYNAALSHYKNGACKRAAKLFNNLLELDPHQDWDTYFYAAHSHYAINSYGPAAKLFDQYLKLDEDVSAVGYFNSALSHYKSGNYSRAAELYDKLLQLNPDQDAFTYLSAAYSHYNYGSYDQAAKHFNKLLEINPDQDASTYSAAVDSHEKIRNVDRAKEISIEARKRTSSASVIGATDLIDLGEGLVKEKEPNSVGKKQPKQKSSSKEKGKEAMPSAAEVAFNKEFELARDKATLKGGDYQRAEEGVHSLAELVERPSLRKGRKKKVLESWLLACKELCVYYGATGKYREIIELFKGRENYLEGDRDLEQDLKDRLITANKKLERSQKQRAKQSKNGKASSAARYAPQPKKAGPLHGAKRGRVNSSSSSEDEEKYPSVGGVTITSETRELIRRNSMLEVNAALANGGTTFDPKSFMNAMITEHGPEVAQTALRAAQRAHSIFTRVAEGVKKPKTKRTQNNIPFTVHFPSGEDILDVSDMQSVAVKGLEIHNSLKLAEILERLRSEAPHSREIWSDGDHNFGSLKSRKNKNIYYVRITEKHRLFFHVDKKTHKVTVLQVGDHDFRK